MTADETVKHTLGELMIARILLAARVEELESKLATVTAERDALKPAEPDK